MKIPDYVVDLCLKESQSFTLTRSPDRVNKFGEVFTPTSVVLEMLAKLPDHAWRLGNTYIDPTCGNGQFLAAVLLIKQELGHTNPLATIYGVDIMPDNVDECRQRLINIVGDTASHWDIVRANICHENAFSYKYEFSSELTPSQTLFNWV